MATPKNPLISEKNSKLRLEFARGHIDKGISGIVFYLMMKVNMKFWKTMGVQKVWRIPNTALSFKNITNTVKHGGGNGLESNDLICSGKIFIE